MLVVPDKAGIKAALLCTDINKSIPTATTDDPYQTSHEDGVGKLWRAIIKRSGYGADRSQLSFR